MLERRSEAQLMGCVGADKHLTAKMGLFEEIERAWFTVDNKLFLWDYADG